MEEHLDIARVLRAGLLRVGALRVGVLEVYRPVIMTRTMNLNLKRWHFGLSRI